MKPDQTSVAEQAVQLPHRERARLALRLIESLDPGQDEDVDALWLDEAERRLHQHDRDGIQTRSVEEALSEIERQLR